MNGDISLLFHRAEEHDETTKLILQSKHTWSGCEQNTLTRHISSCFTHTHVNVARDITKQREQRSLGYCWQWKANGQCSKGDNCSFRHDINKRAKSTQPNPSPRSSTRQNEKNASTTRSPRGKSPSGRMFRARITSKELAPFHSVKNSILLSAFSSSQKMDANLVKSALFRIARLKNSIAKGLKRMVTEAQWLC